MLTSVMPELPRLPFILVNIHTTNSEYGRKKLQYNKI